MPLTGRCGRHLPQVLLQLSLQSRGNDVAGLYCDDERAGGVSIGEGERPLDSRRRSSNVRCRHEGARSRFYFYLGQKFAELCHLSVDTG